MSLKASANAAELKEAMEVIKDLGIPDHLQLRALEHLLASGQTKQDPSPMDPDKMVSPSPQSSGGTTDLRAFIAEKRPKAAVQEIPCLVYWAAKNEGMDAVNEADVLKLYRRANIRPPKNIAQSLRDLASSKYLRLEAVKDRAGYVKLSQVGEDIVLYELGKTD